MSELIFVINFLIVFCIISIERKIKKIYLFILIIKNMIEFCIKLLNSINIFQVRIFIFFNICSEEA